MSSVTTVEGIIKNGQIVLSEDCSLPESAKVFVIVPNQNSSGAHVRSPRLVDKTRLKDFKRVIVEIDNDEVQ